MICCATVGPRSWLDSDLPLFPERTRAHLHTQENGPLTVHWLISRVSVQCVSVGPRLRSSLTSISWAFPSLSRRCCLWMRLTFFSHCSEHDLGFCCTHCTPHPPRKISKTQQIEKAALCWGHVRQLFFTNRGRCLLLNLSISLTQISQNDTTEPLDFKQTCFLY